MISDTVDYYDYLVSLVDIGVHHELLADMFRVDFHEIVPNDSNREEDGIQLREEWANDTLREVYIGGCTFLEMLIGVARRMDLNSMVTPDVKYPVAHWFWKLAENMELYDCHDNIVVLTNVVERTYGPDGQGGMFPLENPSEDQREVEIWYQMMAWLNEN